MPQLLSHWFPPLFRKGRHYRPISGELLWCRSFIAGSLADNENDGDPISPQANLVWKYHLETSFLVLLIRFYEGVMLTHQTSEAGTFPKCFLHPTYAVQPV
jgi:hypothetical protein